MITKNKPSPLLTLWYKPAASMRGLLDAGQGHSAALLIAAFFGAVQSGRFALEQAESGPLPFVFGGLAGAGGLYLFGWLTRNFGRWFGAEAAQRDTRTALGLGLLPWTLLSMMLSFMVGAEMAPEVIVSYAPVFFVVFVYGYVIILLALSAALRLSALKTFLCLVVTVLVSLFPLTLFAQLLANMFASAV
ncbi:MAG: hypothetical protein ACI8Z5_001321 [Lentimonas sp.]|jgi:hypothetical protein